MDKVDHKKKRMNSFLGKKREANPLFNNLLFRQMFQSESKTHNVGNQLYEAASWRYKHLFSFNWDDKCIKDNLYPSDIDKLATKKTSLLKTRHQLVSELLSLNIYYEKEEELHNSTGNSSSSAQDSISNSPFTFNELETKLYDTLRRLKEINEIRTNKLKLKLSRSTRDSYWNDSSYIEDSLFRDMIFYQKEKEDYFNYLQRQKRRRINEIKHLEKIFQIEEEINKTKEEDDWVCCVCNNGDHNENQLIYECESCSVTVHQACYGIKTQSVQNWKCDPCSQMTKEESQELDCILCKVKGGAMKQVKLPLNCTFVRNIMTVRNSQSSDMSSSMDDFCSKKCFPKYNSSIIIPQKDYSVIDCAWVHLSCALWNPTISFGNFEEKTQIGNLEMIEYKQFEEKCSICNMKNYGPTLPCYIKGCSFKCHPECARINKYHLEIENVKGTHQPIKIIKNISTRNDTLREDIEEFNDVLCKIYRGFEREYKVNLLSIQPQGKLLLSLFEGYNKYTKESPLRNCEILIDNRKLPEINRACLNPNQKQFLGKIAHLCKIYSNTNRIVLIKSKERDGGEVSYRVDQLNDDNLLSYEDLFMSDFPWELLRFKNYTRTKLKKYFRRLVPDKDWYNTLVITKKKPLIVEELKKTVEIIQENGEKTVREFEEDTNLYCNCKQKYSPGDMMICCERGYDCQGSYEGWYHVQCIDEARMMPQDELDSFKFICNECKKSD